MIMIEFREQGQILNQKYREQSEVSEKKRKYKMGDQAIDLLCWLKLILF